MQYEKQTYGNTGVVNRDYANGAVLHPSALPGRKLPEKKFRAGGISISIWQNSGIAKAGGVSVYRTVSMERSYRDKNGVWQKTNSFRINDLPKAALLLTKAYEYLVLNQNIYEADSQTNVVKDCVVEEEIVM